MLKLRAAVLGAGPAGFYAARALLQRFPDLHVDILDRLPTPFGLIRYGVAPDHPNTKNVISQLSNYVSHYNPRLSFLGNVPAGPGTQIPLHTLQKLYNLVVVATGPAGVRELSGVEFQKGVAVKSAHEFIMWVNGHPELEEKVREEIEGGLMAGGGKIGVIGVGNVALDVARLLLKRGNGMEGTDVSERAKRVLEKADIKEVVVVGRKGPEGAAWTTAALREVVEKVEGVVVECDEAIIEKGMAVRGLPRAKIRMLKMLKEGIVEEGMGGDDVGRMRLRFWRSPKRFEIVEGGAVRMSLEGIGVGGEVVEVEECDMVFLSLGYVGGEGEGYRVGWANGKATGIIGDNKWDAESLVAALPKMDNVDETPGLLHLLRERGTEVVSWEGWLRIDAEENRRGLVQSRVGGKVKIESLSEMLQVAQATPPA